MKKVDVGQTVGIVANVGVIAGIVFLGLQIRNEADQAGVVGIQAATNQFLALYDNIIGDEAIAKIYAAGLADYYSLSDTEQVRFDAMMRSWVFVGGATEAGVETVGLGERPSNPRDRTTAQEIMRYLDQPGFRQWWASTDRRGLPGRQVRLIDDLISLEQEAQSINEGP